MASMSEKMVSSTGYRPEEAGFSCSIVQYSTVTVQYSTVQYSLVQYSIVQATPPAAVGSSAAAGTGWPGPEQRAPGGSSVMLEHQIV